MTSKAYLVSWLGQGRIIWTPLEQTAAGGLTLPSILEGPVKAALDVAAKNAKVAADVQHLFDPTTFALNQIQTTVNIASNLAMLSVGLQLAGLTQGLRLLQQVKEVDRKIAVISGKFELHFLERSLDFFLDSHKNHVGLISQGSAALEEDCYNAVQALVDNHDLKVPAYLRFKMITQAQAIQAWNELVYSIVHDGSLPRISTERLERWVREADPTTKSLPPGGYAAQSEILAIWQTLIDSTQESSNWINRIFKNDSRPLLARALSKSNFERAYPVILLAREIQNALSFAEALEEKLKLQKNTSILIKAS